MNADQLSTILKTLKSQAAPGAWDAALSSLQEPSSTPLATPSSKKEGGEGGQAVPPEKPKRVLSDEQKAKKKAEAPESGESAAATAAPSEVAVAAVAAVAEAPKKRGPKKLSEMTPEELAAHKAKVAATRAKREAKKTDDGASVATEPEGGQAAPSEKPKTTNPWILFTQRVEKLVRDDEEARGVDKKEKMKTVVVKQFASELKKRQAYESWTDEGVVDALRSWVPPVKAAAVAVAVATATADKGEMKLIDGESYIVLKNGATYRAADWPGAEEGELGEYVGMFKNGEVDTSAEEPK